jgi:hypothetical protein
MRTKFENRWRAENSGPGATTIVVAQRLLVERQRIDARRQLDPQHEPAARARHARPLGELGGDRLAVALDVPGERRAQPAQVALVAARREELGDRHPGQRWARQRMAVLEPDDLRVPPPAGDPAHAIARRKRLGHRAHQHDVAILARPGERAQGPRPRAVEHELAIDVVLDHRDLGAAGDAHEALALIVGHDRAERVRERRRDHERAHGLGAQRLLERGDIEAMPRMRRDLDRAQPEPLDHLQHAEVRRRLDRDHVARASHRAQRQREGLGGADRRAQIVLGQRDPGVDRAARDLPAQREQAGRGLVARSHRGHLTHDLGDDPVQLGDGQERGIDRRAPERHERRIAHRLQDLGVRVGDRHARRPLAHARRPGLGGGREAPPHEVARLRSHLDEAGILELEVRLDHGGHADAALLCEPAHRRQPVTGA